MEWRGGSAYSESPLLSICLCSPFLLSLPPRTHTHTHTHTQSFTDEVHAYEQWLATLNDLSHGLITRHHSNDDTCDLQETMNDLNTRWKVMERYVYCTYAYTLALLTVCGVSAIQEFSERCGDVVKKLIWHEAKLSVISAPNHAYA